MTPTDTLVAKIREIASFKLEDALDARQEMDGDRYADLSEQEEWRQDDDRARAQDINAERKLLGF